MKKFFTSVVFSMLLLSCTDDETNGKANSLDLSLFPGTWSTMQEFDDTMNYVESTYLTDGRKCTVFIEFNKKYSKVTYAIGNWNITNNILSISSTKSNNPYIKVNEVITDIVVDINNDTLTLKAKDSFNEPPYLRYRVKEARNAIHCKYGS